MKVRDMTVVDSSTRTFLSSVLIPLLHPSSGGLRSSSSGVHDSSSDLVSPVLVTFGFTVSVVMLSTIQLAGWGFWGMTDV